MSETERIVASAGKVLIARQVTSVLIALAGTLVLTRLLGPENFGIYAASAALMLLIQNFAEWGVDVDLTRRVVVPTPSVVVSARLFLILAACAVSTLVLGICIALAHFGHPEAIVVAVMTSALPLIVTYQVPLAILERDFRYRVVAGAELASQVLLYVTACTLAIWFRSPYVLVAGWLVSHATQFVVYEAAARLPFLGEWSRSELRSFWSHGWRYSLSSWTWDLRQAFLAVVILPAGGAAAAGHYALATRLIDIAGIAKQATWRLSLPLLSRANGDRAKVQRVLDEGSAAQLFLAGLPTLAVAIAGPMLLPSLFGEEWSAAASMLPFLAIGLTVNSYFNMHSSIILSQGKFLRLIPYHLAFNFLLFTAAIPAMAILGGVGAAVAELAALLSYTLLLWTFSPLPYTPVRWSSAIWLMAIVSALLLSATNVWWIGVVVLIVPLAFKRPRGSVQGLYSFAHGARAR